MKMNTRSFFDNICILGASSWIGFLVAREICSLNNKGAHSGTYSTNLPVFPSNFNGELARTLEEQFLFVKANKPKILFNFLRGETDDDLLFHQRLVDYCRKSSCFYVYASSALVLDGYHGVPLDETLKSKSVTEYGRFKGVCEEILERIIPQGSIVLRFASIQGWIAHKPTRNQQFLEKMKEGVPVSVDRGVRQNRLRDIWLVKMMLQVLEDHHTGIFHFGTIDSSYEDAYLRKVAMAFGWSPDLIKPGKQREVNLNLQTTRTTKLYGERFQFSEKQTIHSLLRIPELQKYVRA